MRKILKKLWIIQEKKLWIIQEKEFKNPLNNVYRKHRLNPYNPMSYITILIVLLVGIFMFGFVGFWNETDKVNPFKWR
jgi:hypothetical protein